MMQKGDDRGYGYGINDIVLAAALVAARFSVRLFISVADL
jgi:hypothetical protein